MALIAWSVVLEQPDNPPAHTPPAVVLVSGTARRKLRTGRAYREEAVVRLAYLTGPRREGR